MSHGPGVMTPEEHLLLNEVIETRFGLSFPAGKRELLESRLRPRLQALHLRRFIDYYLLLQYDLDAEAHHLARLVTNNETYFLRETYQFEGLFGEGLEALGVSPAGAIRILSAGCSSGEEAYSLNIYAREAAARSGGPRCTIDAFDLDADRVRMARQAVYGAGSLRSVDEARRERYFQAVDGDRFALRRFYRQRVGFACGNILAVDSYGQGPPYDAVFCRNVLIYFSEAAFHQSVANFARVLRPGGLLFLGHSESLIGRSEHFETVCLDRCVAYRRVRD
ncbi:MAG TPA: protein-glutamate O-methyltransferase CheR [Thermoanaerobaculia bacterium]|nr:protein-glutamate O-methyltransferase CheR [Thermoanaerobaculia bacterium]